MSQIQLRSSEGEMIAVDFEILQSFGALKGMIDIGIQDDSGVIPLPTVRAQILRDIIAFLEFHKLDLYWAEDAMRSLHEWDVQFFNGVKVKIFEIVQVADFLDIKMLMNSACMYVANFIMSNRTPAEIRDIFMIENDMPAIASNSLTLQDVESLPDDTASEDTED